MATDYYMQMIDSADRKRIREAGRRQRGLEPNSAALLREKDKPFDGDLSEEEDESRSSSETSSSSSDGSSSSTSSSTDSESMPMDPEERLMAHAKVRAVARAIREQEQDLHFGAFGAVREPVLIGKSYTQMSSEAFMLAATSGLDSVRELQAGRDFAKRRALASMPRGGYDRFPSPSGAALATEIVCQVIDNELPRRTPADARTVNAEMGLSATSGVKERDEAKRKALAGMRGGAR